MTPLHLAAREGHIETVSLLCRRAKGMRARIVNACDVYKRTALHKAAFRGDSEVVVALLKNGADPTCQDELGDTPIDNARNQRHSDVVTILEGISRSYGSVRS
jgi:ankyrin repeat protein